MEEKIINLIVIDDSFDSEEKIISSLRTTGHTARSSRVEDDEDLIEALKKHIPDLVIYFEGMELISLKETIECLKKNKESENCRVISVSKTAEVNTVAAMKAGAVDATSFTDINHLILIIAREHQSLINARKISQLQKSYSDSEKRCNSLLDSSRDAIAYVHEGMHVYSNRSYLEMFDIKNSDDLEGLPILDMVAVNDRDNFKNVLRAYTNNNDHNEKLETTLHKPNKEEFQGEMEFSPAQIDGEPCIQIIIRKEDTGSEELQRKLKLLAKQDQLTGLYNRQYGIGKLESIIKDCGKGKYTAALMEIRIDNYEEIKNSVGVVTSDQFIAEAAQVLKATVHDGDILARYTHDSFVVIAINQHQDNIESYAAEFQKAIEALETSINDSKINTTVSIGLVLIDKDSPEYNEILARAEKAMISATEKGTAQIITYVPEKGELTRHEADATFKKQLTDVLKNDKFVLYYQPIVSLHGDTDERYEVFARLEASDDANQLMMSEDFLPAAERTGMAIAFDRWVLNKTISEHKIRSEQDQNTRFFIKLSSSSIKDDTLIDWLKHQIKEHKIPANTLNFEVKETMAVTNLKKAKALSHDLKKIKCGFILDDFGSVANPFQLLDQIHVDYVKLDGKLMEDLTENTERQDTIKNIAHQAAELDKFTIAQHVPDANSLSILWGMGLTFIQGSFLQEPLPTMEYDFSGMSG
jgi:diguanylate cyclase (GGDEF)-like protein